MPQIERASRKKLEGKVVSDKMNKTRVIAVQWSKKDPRYGKILRLTTKVFADDPKNESKLGDLVRLESTRPLSKLKNWRIANILERK